MYANTSNFTLADWHFELNQSRDASKKTRLSGQAFNLWPDLALPPPDYKQSRLAFCRVLPAILLHMMFLGLLMAHAHYANLDISDALLTQSGKAEASGLLLGRVNLAAPKSSGLRTPPVTGPEQTTPAPQESPATEQAQPAAVAQKEAQPIPLKASRPTPSKKPDTPRRATAETSTSAMPKAEVPKGEKSAARGASPSVTSPGNYNHGFAGTGGGSAASGGLATFGGSEGPSFKRIVQPEYPAQARRQGIAGQVLLRIQLTSTGSVKSIKVVKSAHDLLSKAALDAVARSSFNPLQRNGKPVDCETLLPISFTLKHG